LLLVKKLLINGEQEEDASDRFTRFLCHVGTYVRTYYVCTQMLCMYVCDVCDDVYNMSMYPIFIHRGIYTHQDMAW
jgi:hypothetical protein